MIKPIKTPVVVIVYRRPEAQQKTFDVIRQARPSKLFAIADGPRNDEEKIKCDQARAVIDQVDWDCEVYKIYSDVNLNCGPRIATGLDEVFKQVDRAIILEDDCLPDLSFFYFCDELLEKYKDNEKIMHIAGLNTQAGNKGFKCEDSYYFSQIAQIWGWATWKRAWNTYDFFLKTWPGIKKSGKLKTLLPDYAVQERWSNLFDKIMSDKKSRDKTWDAQWVYNVLFHGLSAVSRQNLITNIGFGEGAGHAINPEDKHADMKRYQVKFPLEYPKEIKINKQADAYTQKYVYKINDCLKKKIKSFMRHYLPEHYYWLKKNLKAC